MNHKFKFLHGHLFCGIGGGAKGINKARPMVDTVQAEFECLGGIDNDPGAIRDFTRAMSVQGTLLDLFDRDQYRDFHDKEPPLGWKEAVPADIHRAFQNRRPDVALLSSPCKGFSGLMSETKSLTAKYQALNRLTLRGIWLLLEAYQSDPVDIILFENVPRIATRGRPLLDKIGALLRHYGYVLRESVHDCGELGGLAQTRKRFLLVARHAQKVPPFLYEPRTRALRGVGEVLGRMPVPGGTAGGPMHRIPALQWKTWVRLAFVEAGSDWRSLNRLNVQDGYLRDYLIVPEYHHGFCGVQRWDDPTGTIAGKSGPTNGAFSVADPRAASGAGQYQQYGVIEWNQTAGTVINVKSPGQGTFSVADPRACTSFEGAGKYRITALEEPAGTVIARSDTGQCAYAVADPRYQWSNDAHRSKMRIVPWEKPGGTVTGSAHVASGALSVADPRPNIQRRKGDAYLTNGHYGVVAWDGSSGAVSGAACHDNGRWSVADPRLPEPTDHLICRITSLDGTWHRPFTTLELAAVQSYIEPEEYLELDGLSDQAWRERIGNLIPPDSAKAIGEEVGRTLMLARMGHTFSLSNSPIWVRNVALALTLPATLEEEKMP